MKLDVATHERAFLVRDGRAVRYLGPGRYYFFSPFGRVKAVRFDARGPTKGAFANHPHQKSAASE